jgi:hypothetical protein
MLHLSANPQETDRLLSRCDLNGELCFFLRCDCGRRHESSNNEKRFGGSPNQLGS